VKHIAACAACRRVLAEETALAHRLALTAPPTAPAEMWERVRALRNTPSPTAVHSPWWNVVFGGAHTRAWGLAVGTTAASLALLFLPSRTVPLPASPSAEAVSALQTTQQTVTQSDDPLADFSEAQWQAVYGTGKKDSI